jgi:hypothetical protein
LRRLLFHFLWILMRSASRQSSHQSHREDGHAWIRMVSHGSFDLAIWMKMGGSRLPRFQGNTLNNGPRKTTLAR